LSGELTARGVKLISGGTDNHMMLIDCGLGRGVFLQDALEAAGITVNKNTIPADLSSPFYPSGVRLGTPYLTARGMKEKEMKQIAEWIFAVMSEIQSFSLPNNKDERAAYLKNFGLSIKKNKKLKQIKSEANKLCRRFPIYK